MKKAFRMVCFVIVVAMMMTTLLVGCGDKKEEPATDTKASTAVETSAVSDTGKIDTSKAVTIKGYLLGDPPPGLQEVEDKLNEKLKADINATMEVNHITWGDYPTKYPLVLASGEPFDFAFSAFWTNYPQYAAKGAFKEIDLEQVKKYMPKHFAAVPELGWKDCLVNGKLYTIPQSFNEQFTYGMLIRGDLRKKYGMPEIKRVSDLEPFMEAVKKNESNMIPYNMRDVNALFNMYTTEDSGYGLYSINGADDNGLTFNLDDDTYKIAGFNDEPYASSFKAAAVWVKGLYDKGYLPKNPYSNKQTYSDMLLQGKTAIAMVNSDECSTFFSTAKEKGMEIEFIPALTPKGKTAVSPQNRNGIALAANTENAERTLMAFDLIMQEESYDYLVNFGIEGKNYVINADGKIDLPEGLAADKNTYPLHTGGYYFSNRDIWKPLATWDPYYISYKEELKKASVLYPLVPFSPVVDNIKTELANVKNVKQQYCEPIFIGMVKDVDAAIKTFYDKLNAAGYDKVKAEITKQAAEYIASRK